MNVNVLAYLMSFYLPLCGTAGAQGVEPPGVVDFSNLHLKGHSEFFMAPAGFSPAQQAVAPVYAEPPAALFAQLQDVAALQPRTYRLDLEPGALQAAWVVRSGVWNFPDIIEVAVLPAPGGGSSFVFYSHAIYGWSDYGVNRQHAKRWMKDLTMKVSK